MQKSKLKHNKKRNTAFLYESLTRELTRCIVANDVENKNKILKVCKTFFNSNSVLQKELQLYNVLRENTNLESKTAERLVQEATRLYSQLDQEEIFSEQTKLIKIINSELSSNIFNNFVPDYKNLATIYQVFNKATPIKERILLEQSIVENLVSKSEQVESKNLQPIDNIVFKTFVTKFNEKYKTELLAEQKQLLTHYVMSGADDGLSLKIFLNEEIGRLKSKIGELLKSEEFIDNSYLNGKTQKLLEKINLFKERPVDHQMLNDVLKIQNFIQEATK